MNFAATTVVLVLACKGYPWDTLENDGIRRTWYRQLEGIDVIFYYGNSSGNRFEGDRLFLNCLESYSNAGLKTILAFDQIMKRYPNLKYVFRTNLSSYVRLDKLRDLLYTFSKEKLYAGIIGNHNGIHFASGCGYFISKDLMQLIVDNRSRLEYSYLDDVCFGKFLTGQGIDIKLMKRLDIVNTAQLNNLKKEDIDPYFHFRCKQAYNRMQDIEVMKKIHALLGY